MLSSTSSPSSNRRLEGLTDPYSPVIVDDLLSGTSDWRNIQDIIRLTFKAMSDVVKAQGGAIRDLERQLPQKLSKTEAQTLLSQKVNTSDLTHHLSELQAVVESRGPLMDLQAQLEQKVSRGDLNFLLGNRPTVEEVKTLVESKASSRELDAAVQTILTKVEDQARETSRRLASCVLDRDLRNIEAMLQEKANQADVDEALNDKASKQMVSNALSRKVNASDIEVLLSRKADISELQSIMNILENKAEVTWAEQLTTQLQSKAESADLAALSDDVAQRATKREVDEVQDALLAEVRETGKQLAVQIASIDEQTSGLTTELDRVRSSLSTAISKKVENKDMDKMLALISKKADEERMTDLLRIHKTELSDLIISVKSETRSDRQNIEQKLSERTTKLEADFRELLNESMRLRTQFAEIQEGHRREQDEQAKYAKSLNSSLKLEFSSELFSLKDQVESLMKGFAAMSKDRATVNDLMDVKSQFQAALSARPSLDHVQGSLSEARSDITSMVQTLREDLKARVSRLEADLFEAVDKKAGMSEVQAYLNEKADSSFVARLCGVKASSEDFEDLRRIVEGIRTDIVTKANKADLDLHVSHTRNALEEAAKDIVMKANIKDVCTLLDMKASTH